MLKISGLDIVRISKNGKKAIRVMQYGNNLWSELELPSGYTFLEYIEATGKQYINTGFVPIVNTSFVAELSVSAGIGNKNLFCAYTNYVLNSKSDTQLEYRIGSSSWVHIATPSVVTSKFKVEFSTKTIKFNGSVIASPNITTLSNTYPMWLFYRDGGSSTYMGYGKLYSCKIYDNSKLVRDFIPAKNSSGVAGLYDMVNGVFYKSATSTNFVAGTEISNPFALINYIESNGNQYIDTGFTPDNNSRIVFDFQSTKSSERNDLIGSRNTTKSKAFTFSVGSNGYWRVGYNTSSPETDVKADTNRHIADLNKNVLTLDGTTIHTATSASFTGYASMYIGAVHAADTAKYQGYAKIYSCKIYDNGLLVRDFIPVLRYDGSYGLYDKVNKRFYNSASGTPFTGA